MSVWCNACGQLSQDAEFCDHCNADLGRAADHLPPERCPLTAHVVPYPEWPKLVAYVQSLARSLDLLHQAELVWVRFAPSALEDIGPLQPGPRPGGADELRALRITNLDVEIFPFRVMPERVRVH